MMGSEMEIDVQELYWLVAVRQAAVAELVERARRDPTPIVAEDLRRLASSGSELLRQLRGARNSISDNLVRLKRLRAYLCDASAGGEQQAS